MTPPPADTARPARAPLPIDEALPSIVEAMRAKPGVILRAPPGAGKTTRVAPALLDTALDAREIVVVEPRRIAARAAAERMAFERGGSVGDEIGYHVRLERRTGPRTRIRVVTEGVLLRMMLDDPFLERIGMILFDEVHERNLDGDVGLALARKLRAEVRPDLKLMLMSATLEAAVFERSFPAFANIEAAGRAHPVAVRYEPLRKEDDAADYLQSALPRLLRETPGDILIFFPGVPEIRRAERGLAGAAESWKCDLLALHGELTLEQQAAVLRRGARRKIIFATNIAETSLTIDGVTAVVDFGLHRTLRADRALGLNRLETERISRASAEQRAGRAGRTAPGVCVRLWSELEHRALAERIEPECMRVDLSGAVLTLLAFGETDVAGFPWIEPPPAGAAERALELLTMLGAVDGGRLTDLGVRMAELPAHPRLARFVLAAAEYGCTAQAAAAAAILSDRDPFFRRDPHERTPHASSSDLLDRVHALAAFEARGTLRHACGELKESSARTVLRARDALLRAAGGTRAASAPDEEEAFGRALLAAYPDRLARRREPGSPKAWIAGGRGARIAPSSAVTEDMILIAVDLEAGGAESLIRCASAVQRAWIPESALSTEVETEFDAAAQRVVARKTILAYGVPIEFRGAAEPSREAAAGLLLSAARADPEHALPMRDPEIVSFLARADCLREWIPEVQLPPLSLYAFLPALCDGRRSFAELLKAPWLDALRGSLEYQHLAALERDVPETIEVPSGSAVRVQYERGKPPVLAVRIQEIFGLLDTPRVARGRVAVVLHLLAPNHRPQQITQDLASFWRNGYPRVRKELRARYPRHAWPEDPIRAEPERRPKPRRTP